MNRLRTIGRIVAGLIFIFSGLSKGVDPMGSMYKFVDYFTAFGLSGLNSIALILGILLCTAEFVIGFAILSGVRMREASWGLIIFMAGFTPLTLILAINNPVTDCGCFGDAIHLTNWQTFLKNIIILLFVIPVFYERKRFDRLFSSLVEWLIVGLAATVFLIFVQINYNNLPVIDFRPYNRGADIIEKMTIPEDAPYDQYDVKLIYERNGEQKEFTIDNYPSDSAWVFVDQKSTLVKKGYRPPIHDFSLTTAYGDDLTDAILKDPGYSLFLISTRLSDASDSEIQAGLDIGLEAKNSGISFYLLTSTSSSEIDIYNSEIDILSCDETTLKTIVRANPGYMLIKEGIILKKWSQKNLPEADKIIENLERYEIKRPLNRLLKLTLIMGVIVILAALISRTKKINK